MAKIINSIDVIKRLKKVIWHFLSPMAVKLIRDDKTYIRIEWFFKMDYHLNIDHPSTLNEKIQWLKLYNRKPEYSRMVDKYEVKNYIHEILGEGYTIKTIGVWDSAYDIPWAQLPNQFVLKCTHDSHGLVICKDKNQLDINVAINRLQNSLDTNYYLQHREWPYKNVKPRIICEEYKEDPLTKELSDYKFYMFNGSFKLLNITTGRNKGDLQINFFNDRLEPINMEWGYKSSLSIPEMPKSLSRMKQIASVLSRDIPFLRVDFYEIDSNPIIGELTFFDGSGYDQIEPFEMDLKLGQMLNINDIVDYEKENIQRNDVPNCK